MNLPDINPAWWGRRWVCVLLRCFHSTLLTQTVLFYFIYFFSKKPNVSSKQSLFLSSASCLCQLGAVSKTPVNIRNSVAITGFNPMSSPSLSGLSIDFAGNKLYWISSANGTINRCNLDGSSLEVLETLKRELARGTALAVMGEWSLSRVHQIATED